MIPATAHVRTRVRRDRPGRGLDLALVGASAVVELVAAAIALGDALLPTSPGWPVAALAHAAAALPLLFAARGGPSRRWWSVAVVLAMPLVGTLVAAATLGTRGRGPGTLRRRRKLLTRAVPTPDAVRDLARALSPCDALFQGGPEQRRGALWALARRVDAEAIALLRRTAAGDDPELALLAALVLDEIDEGAERRSFRTAPAEERHAAG